MRNVLKIALICITLNGWFNVNAQVTIGTELEPEKGVLLDLKERASNSTDNSTADKGMLFPRVTLTDKDNLFPMFESDGSGGYQIGSTLYNKGVEDKNHIGLIVYNVNTTLFSPGLHMWDGVEWRRMDNSSAVEPEIAGLMCGSAQMVPNVYTKDVPFEGILKIPYTGGNGGAYLSTLPVPPSAGTNGLSIELIGGKLNHGAGEVHFRVFGTPQESSPVTAKFDINFLGKLCSGVTVGNAITIKPTEYVRRTLPLSSTTTADSEVTFGHLKVRFNYTGGNTGIPQITTTEGLNTHALAWYRKAGSGGANFMYYLNEPLVAGTWRRIAGRATTPGDYDLNAAYRDIADAIIVLQHDAVQEMYRVTFNVYTTVAQSGQVPAAQGSYTVFVELLN
jgi:hypothetical protein